jgi:hypothetical protein
MNNLKKHAILVEQGTKNWSSVVLIFGIVKQKISIKNSIINWTVPKFPVNLTAPLEQKSPEKKYKDPTQNNFS